MRKMDAYKAYLFLSGAQAFLFALIFTASSVYQITVVGLTPLQLVLVGTFLETICFVFEIPTGIVADVYSRRLSIIIGVLLIGVGFFIEGWFPSFAMVLLAQVGWGLGATFTSGATEAWVADELGEQRTNEAFLRSSQVSSLTGIVGLVTGMLISTFYGPATAVWGGGLGMFVLGLVLIVIMPETGFTPTPRTERSNWGTLFATFREGMGVVRTSSLLVTLLLIEVIFGLFSEGYDRLSNAHVISNFRFPILLGMSLSPVVWFGLLEIVGRFINSGFTEIVKRKLNMNENRAIARALTLIEAALIVSLLAFALAPNFAVVVVAMLCVGVCRSLSGPIFSAWINQQIQSDDSHVRATIFSMFGQANAIGQIGGGPMVGAIGNRSLRLALTVSALLLTPTLALYNRPANTQKAIAE